MAERHSIWFLSWHQVISRCSTPFKLQLQDCLYAICPRLENIWVNLASSRGELAYQVNCKVSLFNCAWLVFPQLLPMPAAFSSVLQSWHIYLYLSLIYILTKGEKREKKKSNLGISSWFLIFLKSKGGKCYREVIVCFLSTYREENGKNSFPSHRVLSYVFAVHWYTIKIWSAALYQWMWP